jgi:hypothetical protein
MLPAAKTDVWMTEKAALALSGLLDKEAFMKAWEAGDPTFPIMSSVKVIRTFQKTDGVEQTLRAEDRLTNLTIARGRPASR